MKPSALFCLALLIIPSIASAKQEYEALPENIRPEHLITDATVREKINRKELQNFLWLTEVDPAKLADLQKKGVRPLFVDVRSPQEYAKGHIKGAENVYLQKWIYEHPETFLAKLEKTFPDKNQPIVFYCNFTIDPVLTPAPRTQGFFSYNTNYAAVQYVLEAAEAKEVRLKNAVRAYNRLPDEKHKDLLPRSRIAALLLHLNGYTNVYHMATTAMLPNGKVETYFKGIEFEGKEKPWKLLK